jgi:hypothetical protein
MAPPTMRSGSSKTSSGTGGMPSKLWRSSDHGDISQTMARDIRSQYGDEPAGRQQGAGYRTIQVEAPARGYRQLTVRTRNGYYAGQPLR